MLVVLVVLFGTICMCFYSMWFSAFFLLFALKKIRSVLFFILFLIYFLFSVFYFSDRSFCEKTHSSKAEATETRKHQVRA